MSGKTPAVQEENGEPTRTVKLNLRENAYDFIEESLRYAELAVDDPSAWKFAIVLAAQGIELLLKARLADEHPLLLLANPDRPAPGPTVGVDSAIARLTSAGVSIAKDDLDRLRLARRLRNEFVHYEVNATVEQLEGVFADLFEFAHVFHYSELGDELHGHLSEDLFAAEAAMIERFRRELIVYQGSEVVRWFPSEIVDAQFALRLSISGTTYDRIRRGAAGDPHEDTTRPCHDCSVVRGQLHAYGCDSERCPRCSGQLLSCGCDWEWEYVEKIDHFVPVAEPTAGSEGSGEEPASTAD